MYLGDYIVIEKQTGPYQFDCCSVSTGTDFVASVDTDKQKFFDDHSFPDQHPSACRFLRPLGSGKIGCTIHTDSPAQCKFYRCVVMVIQSPQGDEIGYVTGTLALHSQDTALHTVWDMLIRKISMDRLEAEEEIRKNLIAAGYEIR
ncbi:MAG TPA: hypothetical protein VN372_14345 [Methanospirillum sp.]|nr:hypothetical protein [Methanospirillum sp.]